MTETGSLPLSRPASRVAKERHLIVPRNGWSSLRLRELWQYRELVYFLTWRDILIRYKQAILGVAWAVLMPFATMIARVQS